MMGFELHKNAFGQLVFNGPDGIPHVGVTPVRAFALTDPEHGLALVSAGGEELLWIEDLKALSTEQRELIEAELAGREFMPEIQRIHSVSSFATPSRWDITTNKGDTELLLKGEEDIRRLHLYGHGVQSLIVTDCHGVEYFIPDRAKLDRHSKKLLERFL